MTQDGLKKSSTAIPESSALTRVYRVARGSCLYHYLNSKHALVQGLTTLGAILPLLKATIVENKLFDPKNPSIILCSQQLENMFGMKALHVKQLRGALLKQLEAVEHDAAAEAAEEQLDDSSDDDEGGPAQTSCAPTTSSPAAATAAASNNSGGAEQKFVMSAGLKALLLPNTGRNVAVTFRQAAALLSRYIIARQHQLFDSRNILVALVTGDPLGAVFGVSAFHRSQTSHLLKAQLTAVQVSVTLHAEAGSASLYTKSGGGQITPVTVRINSNDQAVVEIKQEPEEMEAAAAIEESKNARGSTWSAASTTAATTSTVPRLKRCSDSMSEAELPVKKRIVKYTL